MPEQAWGIWSCYQVDPNRFLGGPMRRTSLLVALAVGIGAAYLSGCAPRPDVTPGAPPPTPVTRIRSRVDEEVEDQSLADLASRFPLPAPAGDAEVVNLDDSQCIACHTDREAVQDLAVEPEEEEELSEGEG